MHRSFTSRAGSGPGPTTALGSPRPISSAMIIVIPLTDYLSRVFSFRRYLIVNTILFLAFSVACAFARNLGGDDRAARPTGVHRRRADPHGLHFGADQVAKAAAADRAVAVRANCDLRARDWSDHRRLSDRNLWLAIYLLRQSGPRYRHGGGAVADTRAQADAAVSARARRLVGHRSHGYRARGSADGAR
jgi:hypothetical protein